MLKFISIILILNGFIANSQDIHFSQFNLIPTQLDPSQTGKINGNQRAIINYRTQWKSITNPFTSTGFSVDSRIGNGYNFFGGGLSVYYDKVGSTNMKLLNVNLSLAYHLEISSESYLSAGFQGGFLQRSVDVSQMEFDNQYDGIGYNPSYDSKENFALTTFFEPDFSFGVSYMYNPVSAKGGFNSRGFNGEKINVGISVQHFSRPPFTYLGNTSFKQSLKYLLYINSSLMLSNTLYLEPSGFFAYQQGAFDYVYGANLKFTISQQSLYTTHSSGTNLYLGLFYRTLDAIIINTMFEKENFSVGLSYDLNLSGLTPSSKTRGGFEISLKYIAPFKNRLRVPSTDK